MKILIVDDMISMRHVMLHILRSLGYDDNDEASDGMHALTLLKKKSYDLVITDYHMPKMDGKKLLETIRQTEEMADLPVLMISCEDSREQVKSIIASKVNGFIVKPFNAKTLEKKLQRINEQCNPICIV